jgi:MraZ protein
MLRGRYDGKITKKFQIALPKKLRSELGDRIVITKGEGKRLIVVSENGLAPLLKGTNLSPFISKDASDFQRFVLGNAYDAVLDSKGRCVLPGYLRDHAELKEDIVFAGIQDWVEIWSKKDWEEEQARLNTKAPEIAERLAKSAQERGSGE